MIITLAALTVTAASPAALAQTGTADTYWVDGTTGLDAPHHGMRFRVRQ